MAVDQRQLNARVEEAVQALARLLPRRIAGVRVEPVGDHLEITLANPYDPDRFLGVSTGDAEVLVEMAGMHTHHADWDGNPDAEAPEAGLVEDALVRIVRLVDGADVAVSYWAGPRGVAGGFRPPELVPTEFGRYPEVDRLEVVGWEPWADQIYHRADPPTPAEPPIS